MSQKIDPTMEQAYMQANHSVSEMNALNVVLIHATPITEPQNMNMWSRASINMTIGGACPVMADVERLQRGDYNIANVCA